MKNSSFAGFLDGYRSRNFASIEPSMQIKLNDTIDLLYNAVNYDGIHNSEMLDFLRKGLSILSERHPSNIISTLCEFGELLRSKIVLINNIILELSPVGKDRMRKIIYNFANLAKMSEETTIINLAIDIGEKFNY